MSNEAITKELCDAKHDALHGDIGDLKKSVDRLFSKIDRVQWLMVTTCAAIVGAVVVFGLKGCA